MHREQCFDPWNEVLMVGIQVPLDWLIVEIFGWEGWGDPLEPLSANTSQPEAQLSHEACCGGQQAVGVSYVGGGGGCWGSCSCM